MKFAAAHELLCRKKFINISWPGKKGWIKGNYKKSKHSYVRYETFVCTVRYESNETEAIIITYAMET